ncbi:hypothetical protein HQQ81_20040 [Microbacteriaceae bacterium VKM Ac-2854]|nr:hypothetical protein [Microbacteriaceae bacterium VKM Ac-2854]
MSSDAETQRIPSGDTQRTREYVWPSADPGPDARTTVIEPEPAAQRSVAQPPPATALGAVEPEVAPRRRGNRGAGLLITLLAALVFAALDLAAVAGVRMLLTGDPVEDALLGGVDVVIASTVGFAIALAVIVLLVNRAGWWAYVLGGFLVALVAGGAALVGQWLALYGAVTPTLEPARLFVRDPAVLLSALAAAVIAREVTVWAGAWIGARGRRLRR